MEADKRGAEKKLNIIFVTSSLYLGGVQKVTYILADALAQRHSVTVAYCVDSGRSHPYSEKCGIRKLPEFNRNAGMPEKIRCIRRQADMLRKIKRELNADVTVSLGNIANLINALSKGTGKTACCERSNPKLSWGKNGQTIMTKFAFRRADLVVFQSETVRNMFAKKIRRKSCILKNPVMIPEKACSCRKKKIVSLGRLTAQKNQTLLIRGFARFHKRHPEYTLRLFGEGELEGPLRELIASLDLSDSVFLEKNDPDVHSRIRDAEMFVLSSDFEGLSNALLECMSMGIACISTACEGSRDVIRNGENGLLTRIGDEEGLAEAMCMLAEDPELRCRIERQAREDMKAYDRYSVVNDWEKAILACVDGLKE
ncbi:MAG: glycosyltransferase [Clostridia bacterium]|nr:glycosyltransferase [Clostridia bacterium]